MLCFLTTNCRSAMWYAILINSVIGVASLSTTNNYRTVEKDIGEGHLSFLEPEINNGNVAHWNHPVNYVEFPWIGHEKSTLEICDGELFYIENEMNRRLFLIICENRFYYNG